MLLVLKNKLKPIWIQIQLRILKLFLILTLMIFTLVFPSSYAQTGTSTIKVEDKRFDITYVVDATVLKVDLDKESRSILVGLDKIGRAHV